MAQKKATRASSREPADSGATLTDKGVQAFRDVLSRGLIGPMNLVLISRERVQEVLDDAVKRGRMTREDANDLGNRLLRRGRKQTDEVLRDLDKLLTRVGERTSVARDRASTAAERARKQVDEATKRARRATGRPAPGKAKAKKAAPRKAAPKPGLPIASYDKLKVDDIRKRTAKLTPAQLRKVRDYEKAHANRKGVLQAIDSKLR